MTAVVMAFVTAFANMVFTSRALNVIHKNFETSGMFSRMTCLRCVNFARTGRESQHLAENNRCIRILDWKQRCQVDETKNFHCRKCQCLFSGNLFLNALWDETIDSNGFTVQNLIIKHLSI